jgi:hypothetical protein
MALQQLFSFVLHTAWFKQPVVKILCVCVAGLLAIALLLSPFSNGKSTQSHNSLSLNKQPSSSGSGSCTEQKKQCSNSSTFSLMPGRLNRFLQ